jgi:hypothetical protein
MAQYSPGSFQQFLVLAALASTDLSDAYPKSVGQGRQELYPDKFDQTAFINRAKLSLKNGGFSQAAIDSFNWDNFNLSNWQALKTLNGNLTLLDDYGDLGCPCITALAKAAQDLEAAAGAKVS